MSKVINKIELIHRAAGKKYITVPIGTELELVEHLTRSHSVVAAINGVEFILEKGQFEEIVTKKAFRPPVKRGRKPKNAPPKPSKSKQRKTG